MTRRSVAFSLPELLVVVAVIALLIALLMPTLRSVRERSRAAVCSMHLRTDGMLKGMVAQDTRYMVPVGEYPSYAFKNYGKSFFLNEPTPYGVMWTWNAILDQWAGEKPEAHLKKRNNVCPSFNNGHLPSTARSYKASYMWTMALPHIDYGEPPNYRLRPLRHERVSPYMLLEVDGFAYHTPYDMNYYFYPVPYNYGVGYKEMAYRHLGTANWLANDGSVNGYQPNAVPNRFSTNP